MKHTFLSWSQSHFPFAVLVLAFGSCSQGFAVRKAVRDASHRGTTLSHETRESYLKARFQTSGGDRCHLNLNSRSRKTLKPLMFVFLFSGKLTSWCSANFTLCFHCGALTVAQDLLWSVVRHIQHISPQTLSEWERERARCKTIITCHHIHYNHIQMWSGARWEGGGGLVEGHRTANYMCRRFVAKRLCHNTPVTFRPCQAWCYCPRLTLACACARACYPRRR